VFTLEPWQTAHAVTPWCTALTEYCVKSPAAVWQVGHPGCVAYVGGAIGMWPVGSAVDSWFLPKVGVVV
jgi:hypothetical protein